MDLAELAERHLVARRRTAAAAVLGAVREWRRLDSRDLTESWAQSAPRLLAVVTAGQTAAAATAQAYTDRATVLQDVRPEPTGTVSAAAFAGYASDGRDLAGLLYLPVIDTKQAIASGSSLPEALGLGERSLRMLVDTQVADAGRAADGVGITANRALTGYVRTISGGACGRCALLAGTRYAYNTGFQRHPHCHCTHVPVASRSKGPPAAVNPRTYFDSLTPAQQDKAFTVHGARAIRDGADISQVVNARRGISTAGSWVANGVTHRGRIDRTGTVTTTTFGTSRRSLAGRRLRETGAGGRQVRRLTPEAIYRLASTRDETIRLLFQHGYIV
ncbi:hypothetical protein [Kitasatospora sp. CB02891]|uniref:VG15 protein n=1 Tax=Kitasatospora sp. CB02891 TaxID=2020329 RepID=UPI000C278696|nr:hypothetical protein [Kitasatospora sp. CB02891]PJN24054.1 hypothetical protein CG736_19350 [Kitasatospora sp. CB02891]